MEELLQIGRTDPLAIVGSVSSILSLGLTVAIFLGVRKLRQFYIFTARLPELNIQLREHASKISSALDSGSLDTTSTREILADAEATLKSLARKVRNPLKSDAKQLIRDIHALEGRRSFLCRILYSLGLTANSVDSISHEDKIQRIYLDLYRLNADCSEVYADAKWER